MRKIDKTLSNYIQGICSDFRSKTKESCDRRNGRGSWYICIYLFLVHTYISVPTSAPRHDTDTDTRARAHTHTHTHTHTTHGVVG